MNSTHTIKGPNSVLSFRRIPMREPSATPATITAIPFYMLLAMTSTPPPSDLGTTPPSDMGSDSGADRRS